MTARHRWFDDLDGDCDTDGVDGSIHYMASSTAIYGTGYLPDADHDRDGDVDNTDLFTFLLDVGRPGQPLFA